VSFQPLTIIFIALRQFSSVLEKSLEQETLMVIATIPVAALMILSDINASKTSAEQFVIAMMIVMTRTVIPQTHAIWIVADASTPNCLTVATA
jgi:hypothetical protein